jgi:NADPH:quinone reductase-like Zn-dependent oxidoreductase
MIENGQIQSIVDTVYPMSGAVEAHHRVDTEQRSGAIVLSIAGSSIE